MDHSVRKTMFSGFNSAQAGILISTDVAARGLDFHGVRWIVHYDVNREVKEYVNRIGRTARLDQEVAIALSLVGQIYLFPYGKRRQLHPALERRCS